MFEQRVFIVGVDDAGNAVTQAPTQQVSQETVDAEIQAARSHIFDMISSLFGQITTEIAAAAKSEQTEQPEQPGCCKYSAIVKAPSPPENIIWSRVGSNVFQYIDANNWLYTASPSGDDVYAVVVHVPDHGFAVYTVDCSDYQQLNNNPDKPLQSVAVLTKDGPTYYDTHQLQMVQLELTELRDQATDWITDDVVVSEVDNGFVVLTYKDSDRTHTHFAAVMREGAANSSEERWAVRFSDCDGSEPAEIFVFRDAAIKYAKRRLVIPNYDEL